MVLSKCVFWSAIQFVITIKFSAFGKINLKLILIYFQFKQYEKNWRNLEDFYSDLDVHYKWARPLSSIHWADLLGLRIIMAVGCGIFVQVTKLGTDCVLSRLNIDCADSPTKLIPIYVILVWDLVQRLVNKTTKRCASAMLL